MTSLMLQKFAMLWPEIALLIGGTLCLFTGMARSESVRRGTVWVAAVSLIVSAILVVTTYERSANVLEMAGLAAFIKLAVCGVGLILLLVAAGVPGRLKQTVAAEHAKSFEPGDIMRGEFFAFFLYSLTGVMLTASADGLVWLFLALELTSLPTYVMVATARDKIDAQESAVKYFFLGALAVAVFLYGFALMYGATGYTDFHSMRDAVAAHMAVTNGQMPHLMLAGLVLAVIGICFKIAAFPMHFYAADVYEGAATPVTAFLAFVPKTAGIVALVLLLSLVGWSHGPGGDQLPQVLTWLLWAIAALTMTIGNLLGLVQRSVKRVLAYSSIAHSGYMLVALLAGPAIGDSAISDGIAAVLFYLIAYGLSTIGAFAVLGLLSARGEEADTFDDIAGMGRRHPLLGAIMLVSVLSLLGMPPLIGFVGKIYLFGAAVEAGFIGLVIVGVINSAISAGYYLRIVAVCYFNDPNEATVPVHMPSRLIGATLAGIGAILLGFFGNDLVTASADALRRTPTPAAAMVDHAASQVEPTRAE